MKSLVDFAILTALEKEAKAVVSRLQNHRTITFEEQDIRTYHLGTVPIQDSERVYQICVVLLPSMGNVSAANAVTDMINRWQPRYILMVGIAGGFPQDDLDLGDVIVANQVVGFEYSKLTDEGIQPRDRVYPASAILLERVRNFWDESWVDQVNAKRPANARRPQPKRFIGPIASGNKVIASTKFRQQLLTHWPKLYAVEMESEGVYAAAFERPQIKNALVVRGVSDMADERKADRWQDYAANVVAAFTIAFLKSGPVDPQGLDKYMSCRALVIEDAPAQQQAISQVLEDLGLEVIAAGDFESALQAIRSAKADVVLLDMQLTEMDIRGQQGILLLDQIKTYQKQAPVIIVSGLPWSGNQVRDFLKEYGAYDYISKPFNPNALRNVVAAAMKKI